MRPTNELCKLTTDDKMTLVVIDSVNYYYHTDLINTIFNCPTVTANGLLFNLDEINATEFHELIMCCVEELNDRMFLFVDKWMNVNPDEWPDINKYYSGLIKKYKDNVLKNVSITNYVELFHILYLANKTDFPNKKNIRLSFGSLQIRFVFNKSSLDIYVIYLDMTRLKMDIKYDSFDKSIINIRSLISHSFVDLNGLYKIDKKILSMVVPHDILMFITEGVLPKTIDDETKEYLLNNNVGQ